MFMTRQMGGRARASRTVLAAMFLAVLALLGGCGSKSGAVEITDARVVLPPPGGMMAAGYMHVRNGTGEPVWLTAAQVTGFDKTDMHENRMESGMMRMREVAEVEVPSGQSVVFEPGGLHLMLSQPDESVSSGTSSLLTLSVRDAAGAVREFSANVAVQSMGMEKHAHH